MLIRDCKNLSWQVDDRLYQFLAPFSGNWQEIEACALDAARIARENMESQKNKEEQPKAE